MEQYEPDSSELEVSTTAGDGAEDLEFGKGEGGLREGAEDTGPREGTIETGPREGTIAAGKIAVLTKKPLPKKFKPLDPF